MNKEDKEIKNYCTSHICEQCKSFLNAQCTKKDKKGHDPGYSKWLGIENPISESISTIDIKELKKQEIKIKKLAKKIKVMEKQIKNLIAENNKEIRETKTINNISKLQLEEGKIKADKVFNSNIFGKMAGSVPAPIEEKIKPTGRFYFSDCFTIYKDKVYYNPANYNRFETKEEAERVAKKVNALLKLEKIAKVLNNGWVPNWNNVNQIKHGIFYHHPDNMFVIGCVYHRDFMSNCFFETEQKAKQAIELMGDDLKYLFESTK